MDITLIEKYVPHAVIIATILVIYFVNKTLKIAASIEKKVEEKKGREIKFFDHKKIWLNVFWSVVFTAILAVAGFITWQQTVLYVFCISGLATLLYEAVLKKMGLTDDES